MAELAIQFDFSLSSVFFILTCLNWCHGGTTHHKKPSTVCMAHWLLFKPYVSDSSAWKRPGGLTHLSPVEKSKWCADPPCVQPQSPWISFINLFVNFMLELIFHQTLHYKIFESKFFSYFLLQKFQAINSPSSFHFQANILVLSIVPEIVQVLSLLLIIVKGLSFLQVSL